VVVTNAAAVRVLSANHQRNWCIVQNTGAGNVRMGGPGVTPSSGIRLLPNGSLTNEQLNTFNGEIWAIAETTTASTVAFIEATP